MKKSMPWICRLPHDLGGNRWHRVQGVEDLDFFTRPATEGAVGWGGFAAVAVFCGIKSISRSGTKSGPWVRSRLALCNDRVRWWSSHTAGRPQAQAPSPSVHSKRSVADGGDLLPSI